MIIVVTGPTGVGKTKLSIALAKKYDAIIINADAMQVYKGLDIGTAKIKEEEKEGIKHYLFDIKNTNEDYSIYDYQKDVRNILSKEHKNIILVGGSALYIKSALYDYTFSDNNKTNNLEKYTNEKLYQMLLDIDKDINVDKNNRRRLIRAYDYYLNNNKSISSNNKGNNLLYKNTIFIGLTTKRDKLYKLINDRVDKMVKEGLFAEVAYYYNNNMLHKPLLTGIGYKETITYFKNELTKEQAIELIKKNSRHYAKRQYTFIKNKLDIKWFDISLDNFQTTVEEVENYIDTKINDSTLH